jgi:hypothetical protein
LVLCSPLVIGHCSCHAVRVVNEQARDARGARGAGSGNGGCHGTARSYTVRAPCTAQKSVALRRIGGERKTAGSGLSMIVRRSKSPSPQPSPGVPGEGAGTAAARNFLQSLGGDLLSTVNDLSRTAHGERSSLLAVAMTNGLWPTKSMP